MHKLAVSCLYKIIQAYGSISTQSGKAFSVLRAPTSDKIPGFLNQAIELKLVFTFECYAEDDALAGQQFNGAIQSHFSHFGFKFGADAVDLPRSLTRSIPSASSSSVVDSNPLPSSSQANFEWNFLMSPKGRRAGSPLGAILSPSSPSAQEITFIQVDKISKHFPRPPIPYQDHLLLFICGSFDHFLRCILTFVDFLVPTRSNLVVGPLAGQPGNGHTCLAMHLWNGFTRSALNEVQGTIQCSDECFQDMVRYQTLVPLFELDLSILVFRPSQLLFSGQNLLLQVSPRNFRHLLQTCFLEHLGLAHHSQTLHHFRHSSHYPNCHLDHHHPKSWFNEQNQSSKRCQYLQHSMNGVNKLTIPSPWQPHHLRQKIL